jgi:hypothetical protein
MWKHNPVANAFNHMFETEGRWKAFIPFLDDGTLLHLRQCLMCVLRGIAFE